MLTNCSYHHYTRYPRQLKIQKKKKRNGKELEPKENVMDSEGEK